MRNQVKLLRVDSEGCRYNVEQVRKMLFEKGITITSVFVDRILEAPSGVPTRVCVPLLLA
jgi:nicotinic acid phosphoribosyltransferase